MDLLLDHLKRHKKLLFGALGLATINQLFSLLDPQIFRLIVDQYATKALQLPQSVFLRGVLLLLAASVGVAFVSRVAKNFQDYYVNVVTQRVGAGLYEQAVTHSFSLPYTAFEDQRSGELLQKLQKARNDSQKLIISAISVLFLSLVGILFVLGYAFFVHWSIGLVYFITIPVVGGSTFAIGRRIKKMQKQIVVESAELAGSTTETLRNVELVKSLGLEGQETKRLNSVNEKILELELKKVRLIRALSFIQGTIINAMRSAILLLMMWLIFTRAITIGEFFSLFVYSFFIFTPLGELSNVSAQYQEAKGSMEEMEKILAMEPMKKPSKPETISQVHSVRFEKVNFAYQNKNDPAVQEISFSLEPGRSAAFVGPSGSGKTTLVKLLVGLYQPTQGKIFVNGISSTKLDYDSFRGKIGYVSQETQLFAGTIRENLLFVNPKATDKECLEVLGQAAALPIVERGGKGLNTKIGEGGIKISGGERQRLAIARALLRVPDVLIFDEATSSLDSLTERSITETIKGITKIRPNLATVMVAHRLSTVVHADVIYVLERGHIVEQGHHSELVALNGLYSALWKEQSSAVYNHQLLVFENMNLIK